VTDSAAEPQFSDDRQWWWNGSEWVPAAQVTQSADLMQTTPDADPSATSPAGASTAGGAVRNATSTGQKAFGWLADQAKKQNEQMKANREAAAARTAQERQTAHEQAAAYQVQFDAWFDLVQRECPMPLVKSRSALPGGLQLMNDECLVGAAKHWGFSSDRLALTTHRLIWSHGRVTKDSQQLYLTDIRDVSYHKPMMGTGTLTVEAAGSHSLEGLVHMKHAQQFRDSLLSMVHYAKQRPQRVMVHTPAVTAASQPVVAPAARAAPDKFEQLTKLGELKAAGILTDQEFESEKAKLLGT
jgi:hypothetical protein